jgi:hypothetical protein
MRKTDIAWAAGLFEGEGTWIVRQPQGKGRFPTAVIALQMTDRDVVERFAEVMGCGRVTSQVDVRENRKPLWRWTTARRVDCKRIAEAMLPYLGERRSARALEIIAVSSQVDGRSLRFKR